MEAVKFRIERMEAATSFVIPAFGLKCECVTKPILCLRLGESRYCKDGGENKINGDKKKCSHF